MIEEVYWICDWIPLAQIRTALFISYVTVAFRTVAMFVVIKTHENVA
jgi:hypothetical protein